MNCLAVRLAESAAAGNQSVAKEPRSAGKTAKRNFHRDILTAGSFLGNSNKPPKILN
jgi:hypothetical protein